MDLNLEYVGMHKGSICSTFLEMGSLLIMPLFTGHQGVSGTCSKPVLGSLAYGEYPVYRGSSKLLVIDNSRSKFCAVNGLPSYLSS